MLLLSASISLVQLSKLVKVPLSLNGLMHGLFIKVPLTMQEAIEIALVKEKS